MDLVVAKKEKLEQSNIEVDDRYVSKVTIRAYRRLCDIWKLSNNIAASLALLDVHKWNSVKLGRWTGTLSEEQIVRIGILFQLYESLHIVFEKPLANKWVTMENKGPLCKGDSPLDVMLKDGLPAMVAFRNYMNKLAR